MKSKNKHIYFLIILFSLMANFSFAQSLDKKIEKRILELRSDSIDTIVSYKLECVGYYITFDPNLKECTPTETKYLFWIKNGIYYKQKFDDCKSDPIIHLDKSPFLSMAISQLESIKEAEIKPVEHYVKDKKGRVENDQIFILRPDHTCFTHFDFIVGKINYTKKICHFELETKMVNEKFENDNYDFNQKSILNTLKKLVEKELY